MKHDFKKLLPARRTQDSGGKKNMMPSKSDEN